MAQLKPATENKGIKKYCLEMAAVLGTVLAIIFVLDTLGLFAYNDANNHTEKRWEYLYRMHKNKQPIDVLILGNSHSYTGLLPKDLSCTLGKTCFVLASQGVYLTDAYYMLKEALEIATPKMVVIETFLMYEYHQRLFNGGDLTCQIQSFEPRRNLLHKLTSTFNLFTVDTAPYAWSKTLRNHSYIFDNTEQLAENIKENTGKEFTEDLYLGRFIRFTSGLEEETLERYKREGAPVKGENMLVSEDAFSAMDKIAGLCEEKGIKIMFLTLPMYKENIENYGAWKKNMAKLIDKYNAPWCDLQENYDHVMLGPDCFEDSYKSNQHMTARGATICTYKLADFIRKNELLDFKTTPDSEWHKLFYAEDGYFENYPPKKDDSKTKLQYQNIKAADLFIKEIITKEADEDGEKSLILKLDRRLNYRRITPFSTIDVWFLSKGQNGSFEAKVHKAPHIYWFNNPSHALYIATIPKDCNLEYISFDGQNLIGIE